MILIPYKIHNYQTKFGNRVKITLEFYIRIESFREYKYILKVSILIFTTQKLQAVIIFILIKMVAAPFIFRGGALFLTITKVYFFPRKFKFNKLFYNVR